MRGLALVSSVSSLLLSVAGNAQAAWQMAYPSQSPPANADWASAFDEARGEALFLFPRNATSSPGWRWNGTTWSQLPGVLPPYRFGCYMVYDAARQRVVLWGGVAPGGGVLNDLWEWDGLAWQQRFVAMPPSRTGAAFAYDRKRAVTVMFGGRNPGTIFILDETWEWNGTTWSNRNPSLRPSAREAAAMAFDSVTQRILMYGGDAANDTWTWDGAAWQQQFPTTPPYQRARPMMVADLERGRVVLHGGLPFDVQTWEWDGAAWHASTPGSPGALIGNSGAYDTQRREVITFGGEIFGIGYSSLTWTYRTPVPANANPFGSGCAGSVGAPQLAIAPYSLPWLGDTARTFVSNLAPSTPGAMFVTSLSVSFLPMSLAPIGAPGCDLLLPPDFLSFEVANDGIADWTVSIPFSVALAGMSIYQQAFPFEAGVNPLGMTASNGLRLILGIR